MLSLFNGQKRVRELEMITEESGNRAIRDIIKASKPATESLDRISKPLGKLEKNDGFTNHGSCLSGREDSFFNKRESVIVVDDDVHEATLSGIRHSDSTMKDEKGEDSNVQERRDDPVIKDIKFNIREGSTPSDSPCNNGNFCCTSSFQVPIELKI